MDIYQTLQWMYGQFQLYEQRIAALENGLRCAEDEIKKLKERPTMHVGTIQYKFDQLKVETLEGTLSIGLNPQDMQGIEDFAVQNGQPMPQGASIPGMPMQPVEMMQRGLPIEEAVNEYIQSDLAAFVADAQKRLGIPQSDSYLSFIQDDIRKQLPGRIESHLRMAGNGGQNEFSAERVVEALKKEIENGVLAFLSNLPGTMKGGPQ